MNELLEQLRDLSSRKERFTFDVKSRCLVRNGVVSAYRATKGDHYAELRDVLAHALSHEGIVGAWRDPATQRVQYDSCRIFTDMSNAKRFAELQGQRSVFDLERNEEISVRAEEPQQ